MNVLLSTNLSHLFNSAIILVKLSKQEYINKVVCRKIVQDLTCMLDILWSAPSVNKYTHKYTQNRINLNNYFIKQGNKNA